MITLQRPSGYSGGRASDYAGRSIDTKPLDVENGSIFEEIDTGKSFMFDGENKIWYEYEKEGGGSGADISVEGITITENGTTTAPSGRAYSPITVKVPTPVTTVNGATGDIQTNWYCHATYSTNGDSVTMDKTVAEIYAAYTAGYNVQCKYTDDTLSSEGTIPLIIVRNSGYCIFSGTGAEDSLLVPTSPVACTIYYDHDSSAWKYKSDGLPTSYLITVSERNGVEVADKTYDEIYGELTGQLLGGRCPSLSLLNATNSGILQISAVGDDGSLIFSGGGMQNNVPVLYTTIIKSDNTITSITSPMSSGFIIVQQSEDGSYVADKTFEEVVDMITTGKSVSLSIDGIVLPLVAANSSSLLFQSIIQTDVFMAMLSENNSIDIKITPLNTEITVSEDGEAYSADMTFEEILLDLQMGISAKVVFSDRRYEMQRYSESLIDFSATYLEDASVIIETFTVTSDDTWSHKKVSIMGTEV